MFKILRNVENGNIILTTHKKFPFQRFTLTLFSNRNTGEIIFEEIHAQQYMVKCTLTKTR